MRFRAGDRVRYNIIGLIQWHPLTRYETVATVLKVNPRLHPKVRIRWDTQDQPDTVDAQYLELAGDNVGSNIRKIIARTGRVPHGQRRRR